MPADWEAIRARMKVVVPEWRREQEHRPPAEAIDTYEEATGFHLPESYRQFLLEIGPGEFAAFHVIHPPDYPGRRSRVRDLARLGAEFREWHFDGRSDEEVARSWADVPRARRLHFFASTCGGDYFGWDPQDVRDEAAREYGIYELPHSDQTVACVAGSFYQFVDKVCLKGTSAKRRRVFSPE